MAENKQYIIQSQQNGQVLISEDVIATIIANTVKDVDGVVSMTIKSDIVEMISKKHWTKGMRIVIDDDNKLSIDCNIIVAYGHGVVEVGKAVQDAVTNAVVAMTGVNVACVNVNVCGIVRQ